MNNVLTFPRKTAANKSSLQAADDEQAVLKHLERYQWHYGRDAYWFFVTKHNRLPDKQEALTLGRLLNHKVKSTDGKYYPRKSRKERQVAAIEANVRLQQERVDEARLTLEASISALNEVSISSSFLARELRMNSNLDMANRVKTAINWWLEFAREWTSDDKEHQRANKRKNSRSIVQN